MVQVVDRLLVQSFSAYCMIEEGYTPEGGRGLLTKEVLQDPSEKLVNEITTLA